MTYNFSSGSVDSIIAGHSLKHIGERFEMQVEDSVIPLVTCSCGTAYSLRNENQQSSSRYNSSKRGY